MYDTQELQRAFEQQVAKRFATGVPVNINMTRGIAFSVSMIELGCWNRRGQDEEFWGTIFSHLEAKINKDCWTFPYLLDSPEVFRQHDLALNAPTQTFSVVFSVVIHYYDPNNQRTEWEA